MSYPNEICTVISTFVNNHLSLSTYAIGEEIDIASIGIPAVVVSGVGRIGYPLSSQQATALVGVSTQAPFGKGMETILDPEVRKAWQINTSLVTVNEKWMKTSLPKLVSHCCSKLGINAEKLNVQAHLYKMLLYEEGGHFKRHRDTEKEPGMFGSLLVQLPAEHEGGALVVMHQGSTKRFDFCKDSGDKAYITSFYADCEHVLEPVTKGLRLVLAFNLVRDVQLLTSDILIPIVPNQQSVDDILTLAKNEWVNDKLGVQKYVYPLSHQYTQTNVSFEGLKGNDKKIVNLLQNAIDPTTNSKLFSVYLALVTKHVSGTAEYEGYNSTVMCTDGDIEVECTTDTWIGPHGAFDFGNLQIDFDTEVITEDYDDDEQEDEVYGKSYGIFGDDPDSEEDEGYCGNYAGSLEYWYYSAAVVFWPAEMDFKIRVSANPEESISYLEKLNPSSEEFSFKYDTLLSSLNSRQNIKYSLSRLLALTQNIYQVKKVLRLCQLKSFDMSCVNNIVIEVFKYGFAALSPVVGHIIGSKCQSLETATALLTAIKERLCPLRDDRSSSSDDFAAPWNELLQMLVSKASELLNDKSVAKSVSLGKILALAQSIDQVKLVLSLCDRQAVDNAGAGLIVQDVQKYGISALLSELSLIIASKCQSAEIVVVMLTLIKNQLNLDGIHENVSIWNDVFQKLINRIVDLLREIPYPHSSMTVSLGKLLALTQNVDQVRLVLNLCDRKSIDVASALNVVDYVLKYGFVELSVELVLIISSACQSLGVATLLLDKTKQKLNIENEIDSDRSFSVTDECWNGLLQRLIYRSQRPLYNVQDEEYVSFCEFAAQNCDEADQHNIGSFLGRHLSMQCICKIIDRICNDLKAMPMLAKLKEECVLRCTTSSFSKQNIGDLVKVIECIIKGNDVNLMNTLGPKFELLCKSKELFRAIFSNKSVEIEMKRDSPLNFTLKKGIEARMNVLSTEGLVTPSFSWCMPTLQHRDPKVRAFLRGPQDTHVISGFNGIRHAREWSCGSELTAFIETTPTGTGSNARVILRKKRTYYNQLVEKCSTNANEYNTLRKMLGVRDIASIDNDTSASSSDRLQDNHKRSKTENIPIEYVYIE